MNTKEVSLYLLKGRPSIHCSEFRSTFPEPSDLRFGLNRFGQQTVICSFYEPSNLTSEKVSRFPCDLRSFLDNQRVSDAGWKILGTGECSEHKLSRVWLGSWTQRKASIYTESVGTEPWQATMDHVRAHSSLPGRTGDFLKNSSAPHWTNPTACKPVGKKRITSVHI